MAQQNIEGLADHLAAAPAPPRTALGLPFRRRLLLGRLGLAERGLVLAGLGFTLLTILVVSLLMAQLHRQTIRNAERELTNLALVLASDMQNSFHAVELLQAGIIDLIDQMQVASVEEFNARLATQAVNHDLAGRIAAVPQVEAVFLTNADGITINSTRSWPTRAFSIADRPHFAVLRDNPALEIHLAPPARNLLTGTWNIYLSRRLTTAEGRFLGIVGVGLSLTYFEEFLSRIALGGGSSIGLWRRDGILMARHPHATEAIGRRLQGPLLPFQQVLQHTEAGTGQTASAVDGLSRTFAVRALAGYPAAMVVTRRNDDILRLWHQQVGYAAAGVVVLAAIVLGAVILGIRQLQHRAALERSHLEMRVLAEQHRAAAQIAHLAHHDALTGLANRTLFRTRLDEAVARARRGEGFAVLCLDLDHFKDVNDSLGHPIGDLLLQAVTVRLRATVRELDTIARLGGDEFAVVQAHVTWPSDAAALAQRLVEALAAPYLLEGNSISISASIGISLAPDDGMDADQLLRNADLALYRAKADGRGCLRFFEAEMNNRALLRRSLQLDLQRALEAREFEVFYQSQVNTLSRRLTGFEALLRWRHPERGLVPPDRFIPQAEEMGLIIPLGEWVLQEACRTAASWAGPWKIAVNLSPVQFASSRLVGAVATALERSGLDPARLELEITETVMLQNTEATLATLHQLKALGVTIALDDFGTGYSSLSYLQRFPFDTVKIDGGFIRNLEHSQTSVAIVRAVTDLCTALGMATIAEGVETESQWQALRRLGCTEAQGFLFSRPCPAADLTAMLAQEQALDGLQHRTA
jgi:diguanylate cyclase (GGDEF)-like protein